ncbi:hypothetical protein A3842_26200 [Paenibacillus sp. P3E]|nr:hypothetical protein A3842_26200 [Paenibacillus sp. P3E]
MFSLIPAKDKSKQNVLENYFEYASNKILLRSAVIYGANASGKTNTLMALSYMKFMVTRSHTFQKDEGIDTDPFLLDPITTNKPSIFDIQFYTNGVRYAYGFKLDRHKVIEEYLYYWPNDRQRVIFERVNVNEYKFVTNKAKQNTIKELTADNILYFSNAFKLNLELVADAYKWFNNTLKYNNNERGEDVLKLLNDDRDLLKLTIQALEIADFGIKEIKIKEEEIDNDIIKLFPDEVKEKIKGQKIYEVRAVHNVLLDDDSPFSAEIDWVDESKGTRKFLGIMVPILVALQEGNVICIDELDVSMHPKLTEYLLSLFHDSHTNKKNAQLIFTTHDTNLLNQGLFRRDQIWLTEKDSTTGCSDLYSLVELKIRNDENIEKGYLSGRYGALPFIKGGDLIG